MTDLAPIKNNFPAVVREKLTEAEQRYIDISFSKRVADIPEPELLTFLRDILRTTYHTTGNQIPGNNMDEHRTHLDMVCLDWKNKLLATSKFTPIAEIKESCSLGSIKTFGEHYGKICVATFMEWLNSYHFQNERVTAINRFNSLKLAEEKRLISKSVTSEDMEKIFRDAYNLELNRFKSGKKINDTGNAVFNGLFKRGFLRYSKETAERWTMEAKNKIYAEISEKREMAGSLDEARSLTDQLNQFMEGSEKLDNLIDAEAKRIGLAEYFNKVAI